MSARVLTIGETVRTHARTHARTVVRQMERIAVEAFQNDCAGKPRRNENSPIRVLVEPDASVRSTLRTLHSTARARSNG